MVIASLPTLLCKFLCILRLLCLLDYHVQLPSLLRMTTYSSVVFRYLSVYLISMVSLCTVTQQMVSCCKQSLEPSMIILLSQIVIQNKYGGTWLLQGMAICYLLTQSRSTMPTVHMATQPLCLPSLLCILSLATTYLCFLPQAAESGGHRHWKQGAVELYPSTFKKVQISPSRFHLLVM